MGGGLEQPKALAGGRRGLWQHSSRGLVDGISGYVDLDVSFRDYAAEDGGGGEPPSEAPAAGTALLLYGVPLYASATAQTRSATVSGRYWVYDGIAVDGRLRITNSASRVERTPIAQNVTGYIDLADAKPEEA
ncbi:MAG: hypothetical protein ACLVL7_01860 [Anaerotruncus massiliensis (ex Togo et al. 2019)]